jgi:hypothetical protein
VHSQGSLKVEEKTDPSDSSLQSQVFGGREKIPVQRHPGQKLARPYFDIMVTHAYNIPTVWEAKAGELWSKAGPRQMHITLSKNK